MPNKESHQSTVYPRTQFMLPEVTITAKAPRTRSYRTFDFLGFKLEQALDTRVHANLESALLDYTGPEIVISSLRRHLNNKSKQNIGKAVDIRLDHSVIEWLVSEQGTI